MTTLPDFVFDEADLDAVEAEQANPYLAQPEAAMRLVAGLLAAPTLLAPGSEEMDALRVLIDDGFGALAPAAGPSGARVARELAALRDALQELVPFPDLANKVTVGFGGSFSAGKSRFLNTLLGVGELLPEGLEPTTAVPTCVIGGARSIRALNRMQRLVPIDREALQALAHGFDRQYGGGGGIGLAHMIELLVVQEPAQRWRHLALLDTPGFSKDDGAGNTLSDAAIARAQLGQCDHIVWLVSARNGALRLDDIHFLQSIGHRAPVFFIVTQADLQSDAAIAAIMDSIEQAAAQAGIACAGVMAWAAPQLSQFGTIVGGADIHAWLDGLDLQPKLTDKRRSAARLMAGLDEELRAALDEGRQELAALNGFWSLADQLPEESVDGLRQLVARQRERQRQRSAQLAAIGEFAQALDEAIGRVFEAMVLADARPVEVIERQYEAAIEALRTRPSPAQEQAIFDSLCDVACHGHVPGQYTLSECYRLGTGTAADAALAFRWCARAAQQGMAQAQFNLGNCYLEGRGTAVDAGAALRWFEEAAQQDHVQAQMRLFAWHAGVDEEADEEADEDADEDADEQVRRARAAPRDLARGIHWLKRAAALACAEAQYELGNRHMTGQGVAKNGTKAWDLYYAAAEHGFAPAQYEIGRSYLQHSEGPDDDAEAVEYFRRAGKQEHAEAQVSLGRCYLDGVGVGAHRAHAASWFRRADALDHPGGATGLGRCHAIAGEFDLAVEQFRRVAEEDAEARYRLGQCYLHGLGVRKNRVKAEELIDSALEQGYVPADGHEDESAA